MTSPQVLRTAPRPRALVLALLLAGALWAIGSPLADRADAATIVVDDLGDTVAADGACTLREAIEATNDNAQVEEPQAGDCAAGEAGPGVRDVIEFAIESPNLQTIAPATPLPVISDRVEIDGRNGSQNNAIRIEIDGSAVPATVETEHGLFLTTGSDGSYIHHLAVFGFPDDGLHLFTDEHIVQRVISGMEQGGSEGDGHGGDGVEVRGDDTTVLGSVISGNDGHGLNIKPVADTTTTIVGNRIGTTPDGTAPVPNGLDGINAWPISFGAGDVVIIGGPAPLDGSCDGDCNLISGNAESGIEIQASVFDPQHEGGVRIEGNYLGTNLAGTEPIPNSSTDNEGAVKLREDTNKVEISGNLVSGNGEDGIMLAAGGGSDGPTDTTIAANIVGLAVDGTTPLPNDRYGIYLDRSLNSGADLTGTTIGGAADPTPDGPCDGDCNLISGNGQSGITIFETDAEGGPIADTAILGNYIGTDAGGTLDRGNGGWGIQLSGVSDTTVGQPGSPNLISGNDQSGVLLVDTQTPGNTIQSNLIGTAADGASPLGNAAHGVEAWPGGGAPNAIGGVGSGEANTIGHNGGAGVMLGGGEDPVFDTPVLGNSIFSNGALGIDLRDDLSPGGVTENGACNEAEGANRCQEFPELTAAAGGSAVAAGTLESDPGKTFRIEVFANAAPDESGNGEGERFLGAVETTTDGAGNATWLFADSAGALPDGEHVSATATELGGQGAPLSTSEFSDTLAAPTCHLSGDEGGNTLNGGAADEVICGFGAADTLSGGGGRDAILGGDGDDTIDAADGVADALIDCGPGSDTVEADGSTIDPEAIFVACEVVNRATPDAPVPPPATTIPAPSPGSATAEAKCGGKQATIVGTSRADKLNGTRKRDVIAGLGGNDTIKGVAGNDLICGGGGNDKLFGHAGKDKLYGGDGKDVLKGGNDRDVLKGQGGEDTLNAGAGSKEACDGGPGKDVRKAPGCERRSRIP